MTSIKLAHKIIQTPNFCTLPKSTKIHLFYKLNANISSWSYGAGTVLKLFSHLWYLGVLLFSGLFSFVQFSVLLSGM